ncbi:MAG: xanthine dehydrogenase small subunit, partial [Candidatus Puniceispirillaceae bacterium]
MRETITFVLNNRIERVSGLSGDATLLDWLRQRRRLTGSKEGCAEGDCGACTVVVARRDSATGAMRWHPVNACIQFMGMLEGTSVTTIEGIMPEGEDAPDLHPCQQVMVDRHGSQCGFCTPGFVMSMFAAWCNGEGLDEAGIDTTLAGNLCRCTGYRPIVDAAADLKTRDIPPAFESRRRAREAALMDEIAHDETVAIGDGTRRFIAPATAEEFAREYATARDATIVAGATDVGLWVTKQNRHMPQMIWTGRVRGFDEMVRQGAHWRIDPAVTHEAALQTLAEGRPDFAEVMRRFGSLQVRSSGTMCGNIANGSPIGDLPPMLIALAADVELAGVSSNRRMPLEDFFIDYGVQDREAGEFVSALLVPVAAS